MVVQRNILCSGGSLVSTPSSPRLSNYCPLNSVMPRKKVYAAGSIDDLGNGTYVVSITPTVAGSYHITVTLDQQVTPERQGGEGLQSPCGILLCAYQPH